MNFQGNLYRWWFPIASKSETTKGTCSSHR